MKIVFLACVKLTSGGKFISYRSILSMHLYTIHERTHMPLLKNDDVRYIMYKQIATSWHNVVLQNVTSIPFLIK